MTRPRVNVRDLVVSGRITPGVGAMLIGLRRELEWRRRPWWERAMLRLLYGGRPS